jgi:4,5-dihydroxyphthalate decarboxylase
VPRLSTVLKRYPHTAKLLDGEIRDPRVELDFQHVEPIFRAFAPMARSQTYDVSEMAIVTYLQAKAYDKPLLLLPSVVAARLQQQCLVYNRRRRKMSVTDLAGARVGVRAYTQTTGVWVRAILHETFGMRTDQIKWVTFEGGHLAEYEDPPFVTRAPAGADLLEMLRAGAIDAAIFGNDLPSDDDIAPVIADPAAADRAWYNAHRFVPINHVVVMTRAAAERDPGCVPAVYDLLKRGKTSAPPAQSDMPDALPDGIDAMRRPLQMILDACDEQRLLPHVLDVDELFAESLRFLADAAR